jgi:hypothetical protein
MLHTPRGLFALSFVQFGTRLPNGQSRFLRQRTASGDELSIGNPKTSANGCFGRSAAFSILFFIFVSFGFAQDKVILTVLFIAQNRIGCKDNSGLGGLVVG